MAHYAVRESPPLRGEIPISTSKNAVLPIMCGALLTGEDVRIERVPELTDVKTLCALLASCGCSVKKEGDALVLNAGALQNPQDEEDVRKMRASVLVLGPLLSRLGEARIPLPGGCAIGQRPIDQHLKGMSALGAKVKFDHGGVTLSGRLRGAVIYLDMPSVGATENLLMAATLASGTTRIENAAKEPEIVDLAAFLNAMGARICGAGTSTIVIEGVRALHAVSWQPISDRIEAGTMACACAITGGELLLSGARAEHLRSLLFKLSDVRFERVVFLERALQGAVAALDLVADRLTAALIHKKCPQDQEKCHSEEHGDIGVDLFHALAFSGGLFLPGRACLVRVLGGFVNKIGHSFSLPSFLRLMAASASSRSFRSSMP